MKVGLLWFDNDPERPIEEKVRRAAKRYQEQRPEPVEGKFGQAVNTCYINPISLNGNGALGDEFHCGQVKVIVTPHALPHHFWLGVTDPSQQGGH
jgi:hypothetical protein